MSITRVLMCPPTYFDVVYSINPWMRIENKVDHDLARRQWDNLHDLLVRLGVAIELINPAPGLPDMTFSGDCGVVVGRQFLCSNFRWPERQPEAAHYARWMEQAGYCVRRVPDGVVFEGLGDVIYHDETVIFGYGPRSDATAAAALRKVFPELRVLGEVHITDAAFFHVALAAAFLSEEVLLYYPEAFDARSRAFLASAVATTIPVDGHDATHHFVCNNIVIGDRVLLDGCSPLLASRIRKAGFEPVAIDMSEFKKSGGSLRCLILKL